MRPGPFTEPTVYEPAMKKVILLIAFTGLAVILVVTNPSMDDYQSYIRQQVMKEIHKSNETPLGQVFGPLAGGFAGTLIASQTIRNDYGLFSIYEFTFGKKRLRLIGIYKNFVVLESSN